MSWSYAGGPFEKISGKDLNRGDQCSASLLLDQAITETGVNILDATPEAIWTCQCTETHTGRCNNGTLETRTLLNGCELGDEITCYSANRSRSPALCVMKPHVVKVNSTVYPRFKKIYIVRKEASGGFHDKSWTLDSENCHPVKASNINPVTDYNSCKKQFESLLNAGMIEEEAFISKDKFCDGEKSQTSRKSHISGIQDLARCFEAYPQLKNELSDQSALKGAGSLKRPDAKGI